MRKLSFKLLLFWFFLTVSFIMISIVLILEAYGYRLNRQTWRLEPTGVIMLDGQPKQVLVNVNGKTNSDNSLPVRLAKILPGQYDVTIEKADYQPWAKTFALAANQAIEQNKIQLFLANPQTAPSTRKMALKNLQDDFKWQAGNLEIKQNEIWLGEELITRFSSTPQGAILTNDRNHIIFQLDREIRVIEIDGTNNIFLLKLPSKEAVAFALFGDKIIYAASGELFESKIK